jgi:hypothetical protein
MQIWRKKYIGRIKKNLNSSNVIFQLNTRRKSLY